MDWDRMSHRQRAGFLGRYVGAGALAGVLDIGKWTLGPGGGGLVTAVEHAAASGTIAVRHSGSRTAPAAALRDHA